MAIDLEEDIRIDYLRDVWLEERQVRLGMLRLDLVHPLVSGNKWFKLKENIQAARASGRRSLLSFGGAYSNHLHALAAAAAAYGLHAIGVVRGLPGDTLSPTLEDCRSMGMELQFVSREIYRRKEDPEYLASLQQHYPEAWLVPEGGNNEAGMSGAGAIASRIPADTGMVCLPVGTGATFSGIRAKLDRHIPMTGFTAMKGGGYLEPGIAGVLPDGQDNWRLETSFHFGGFARYDDVLLRFINGFYERHNIQLDFVYTGKMMYGIYELIRTGIIQAGTHLVCIHTGGLQGNRGLPPGLLPAMQ